MENKKFIYEKLKSLYFTDFKINTQKIQVHVQKIFNFWLSNKVIYEK